MCEDVTYKATIATGQVRDRVCFSRVLGHDSVVTSLAECCRAGNEKNGGRFGRYLDPSTFHDTGVGCLEGTLARLRTLAVHLLLHPSPTPRLLYPSPPPRLRHRSPTPRSSGRGVSRPAEARTSPRRLLASDSTRARPVRAGQECTGGQRVGDGSQHDSSRPSPGRSPPTWPPWCPRPLARWPPWWCPRPLAQGASADGHDSRQARGRRNRSRLFPDLCGGIAADAWNSVHSRERMKLFCDACSTDLAVTAVAAVRCMRQGSAPFSRFSLSHSPAS